MACTLLFMHILHTVFVLKACAMNAYEWLTIWQIALRPTTEYWIRRSHSWEQLKNLLAWDSKNKNYLKIRRPALLHHFPMLFLPYVQMASLIKGNIIFFKLYCASFIYSASVPCIFYIHSTHGYLLKSIGVERID